MLRWTRLAVAAIAVCALPAAAAAQPAEPHGFVDPCTVGNVQEMTTDCEACPVAPADPQACDRRLGRAGYQKKCRTRGDATAWEEVWCTARQPASAAPPTRWRLGIAALLGAAAAAVAAWRLRRRRARA